MSDNLIKKMNVAKNIINEMLSQRGYGILDEQIDEDENCIFAEREENEEYNFKYDKVVIYFFFEDKFNIQKLKYYISNMNDLKLKHCVIVYADQITSGAKKHIEDTSDLDFEIELFSLSELQYNLTKHRLVPQHSLTQYKDAMHIKKQYGSNLPIMFKHEPVSRFYNYHRGDVIKIVRNDGYVLYRIVR